MSKNWRGEEEQQDKEEGQEPYPSRASQEGRHCHVTNNGIALFSGPCDVAT